MAYTVDRNQTHLGWVDLSKNELRNAVLQQVGTDPSSPSEGQMWGRSDLHQFFIRLNGVSSRVALYSDVTAGGISSSILTAKGSLISATAASTPAELTVGSNGKVLQAQSGQTTGLQWVSLASTDLSDFTTAARAAISVTDSSEIDFTYTSGAITGVLINGSVALARLANISAHTYLGNNTGSSAAPIALTRTQLVTDLALVPGDISGFDTQVRTNSLNQMTAPTADLSINSHKLTNLTDGSSAQDAATFGQMVALSNGKINKDAVLGASTANLTLATGFAAGQVIDGYTLVLGDRYLIKNQTSGQDNGIYIITAGTPTRTTDADSTAELQNATVLILNGTVNKGDIYTQTATVTTVGTTSQTWVKTGEGNQTYAADGTSLTLSGTTFSIATGGIDLSSTQISSAALPASKGGTGQAGGYAVGDLLQATGATTLSKLAAVATGNVLISGGVTTASSWGKVGLTTHVSGTLPIANGGTGQTTAAAALTALGGIGRYAQDLTGGSTSEVVTHGLGTRDVTVQVYRQTTPWDMVDVEVERTSTTTVTIRTPGTIAASTYRVVITG